MSLPYNPVGAKKRWNISFMQKYRKFCGWQTLLDMIKGLDFDVLGPQGEKLFHTQEDLDQAAGLIATVFQTGCRICEAIGQTRPDGTRGMKPTDFTILEDRVTFVFEIEKRYIKIGRTITKYKAVDRSRLRWDTLEEAEASGRPYEEYEGYNTERQTALRNADFSIKEPLVPVLLEWRQKALGMKSEYLFSLKYNKAYRIIKAAGAKFGYDFPPHRLRAERATQLRFQTKMSSEELQDWFSWKSVKEAINYTSLAPLTQAKMYDPSYVNYLKSLEITTQ